MLVLYSSRGEPLTQDDINALLREMKIDGDKREHIRDLVICKKYFISALRVCYMSVTILASMTTRDLGQFGP
jgi:hypothetical protein